MTLPEHRATQRGQIVKSMKKTNDNGLFSKSTHHIKDPRVYDPGFVPHQQSINRFCTPAYLLRGVKYYRHIDAKMMVAYFQVYCRLYGVPSLAEMTSYENAWTEMESLPF